MQPSNVFETIDGLLSLVIRPVVIILSLMVAGMLALGIFTRIIIGAPMFGLEELVLICVMWLYMLGATLASKERTHLTADFIQTFIDHEKTVNFFHLLASVISLAMALCFFTWSWDLLAWGLEKRQTTPVFHIPWYISQGSLFCASVMFVFYLIRDVVHDYKALFKPKPTFSGKPAFSGKGE